MVRHYDVSFLMRAVSSQKLPYREPSSDLLEIGNYNLNPGPRILNNCLSGKKTWEGYSFFNDKVPCQDQ